MASSQNWQTLLKQGIAHTSELLSLLHLTPSEVPFALQEQQTFKLRVPHGFAARMKKADPTDPLLLQVLPTTAELVTTPGYSADPLAEAKNNPIPGLLHKYTNRVLLTLTGSCAINCRYCFRRHFPYTDNNPGRAGWQHAIDYIAAHSEIKEVILSGGDPLMLPDPILANLAQQLNAIPHLTTLRIHSRLPIVLPERINTELLQWLTHLRLRPIMVVHCNHANEIDAAVQNAFQRLTQASILLLNQTVLLKGINNDPHILAQLSEALFAAGALPYYLHVLDKVQGAAHFDLSLEEAISIHQKLLGFLPGYLVPKLVKEQGGANSKLPINY